MYLEFRLPNGAGGMAAGYTKQAIRKQLTSVSEQYNLTVTKEVTMPYRYRIKLASEKEYTMFALVWNVKNSYFKYTTWHESINSPIDPKRYSTV